MYYIAVRNASKCYFFDKKYISLNMLKAKLLNPKVCTEARWKFVLEKKKVNMYVVTVFHINQRTEEPTLFLLLTVLPEGRWIEYFLYCIYVRRDLKQYKNTHFRYYNIILHQNETHFNKFFKIADKIFEFLHFDYNYKGLYLNRLILTSFNKIVVSFKILVSSDRTYANFSPSS